MPLNHVSKWFAVEDAKISPLTADPVGGTTTYGTAIDVPGIKSVSLSGSVDSKELRGDNVSLDKQTILTGLTLSVEHARLSLDVLATLLGTAAVVDAGTTPSQTSTLGLLGTNSTPKAFKFQAKTPTGGVDAATTGDGMIVAYKCILTGFPEFGMAEEDYQTVSFEADCVPQAGTANKWLDVVIRETAVALS